MQIPTQLLACIGSVVLLTGCGGGSSDVAVAQPLPQFVSWSGSAGGSHVIDGLNHVFEFYADTGCLYNLQTGKENIVFCLIPGTTNVVAYGPFRGQVRNVLASDGTCQAAIIDQYTGNFADIEVDPYGKEIVATTPLPPAFCGF